MSFSTVGASSSSVTPYIPPEQIDYFARLKSQAREDIHAALELGRILTEPGEEFAIEDYQLCMEVLKQAPRGPEHEEEVKQLLEQLQKKVPSGASSASSASSSSAGSTEEIRESIAYYRERAKTGDLFAILKLAHLLAEVEEDFPEGDYRQCLEWLIPCDPRRKSEIEGLKALLKKKVSPSREQEKEPSLTESLGFVPELGDSFEELRKKAKEGDPEALYRLAICYYDGLGTTKDECKGEYYLKKAVKGGHVEASWLFVRQGLVSRAEGLVERVRTTLVTHATNSASLSAEKLYLLGCIFECGMHSLMFVQPDLEQTVKWYQLAAEMKHIKAMKRLAWLYRCGKEVANEKAAFALHLKLAEMDKVKFMEQVAFDYEHGGGVDRSYERALEWYHRAEKAGSQAVFCHLGGFYRCGHGTPVNNARAADYYRKALLYDLQTNNSGAFGIYISAYISACQDRDEAFSDEEGFKEVLSWIESSTLSHEEKVAFLITVAERNPKIKSLVTAEGISLERLCASASSAASSEGIRKSIEHHKEQAETGEPSAILKLAQLLTEAEEDFPEADYQQCLEWLEEIQGLPDQQVEIEEAKVLLREKISPGPELEKEPSLTESLGFGPELGDSFEELEKKAKEGDPEALYRLAICYDNGWGAKACEGQGYLHLKKAVELGHVGATWLFVRQGLAPSKEPIIEKVRETLLAHATHAVSLSGEELYLLGAVFEYGKRSLGFVRPDLEQAIKWYQMAAEMKHVKAIKRLIWFYRCKKKVKDEKAAFALHLKLAEMGKVKFMKKVASDYSYGSGVDKSPEQALEWYHRAEAVGSQDVFGVLGEFYDDFWGTPVDYARAVDYYQQALLHALKTNNSITFKIYIAAYAKACRNRDKTSSDEEGFKEALSWIESSTLSPAEKATFRAAVKEHNPEMMSLIKVEGASLGCRCPIGPELGEYFERLKFEAERRFEAAYRLALCYYNGWGTEPDEYEGEKALEIAIAQGHVEASWEYLRRHPYRIKETILQTLSEFCAGNDALTSEQLFLVGKGYRRADPLTKAHLAQAIACYRRAAAAGHQEAKKELIKIWRHGVECEGERECFKDSQRCFPLLVELAEQGDVEAMKDLAHTYWCGLGILQDEHLATHWYRKAEDHEHLSEFYLGYYNQAIRREGLDYFIERKNAVSYAQAAQHYARENPETGAQEAINLVNNSTTLTEAEKKAFLNRLRQIFTNKFSDRESLDYFIERKNAASYARVARNYAGESPTRAQEAINLVKNSTTLTQAEKETFLNALKRVLPDAFSSSCVLQ